MDSPAYLESATWPDIIRLAMQRTFASEASVPQAGMTVEQVENAVSLLFEESGVDRRITDIRTHLAHNAGDNGRRYFRRLRQGVYIVAQPGG